MPWLHEEALNKAKKRLRILGGDNGEGQRQSEELEESMGGLSTTMGNAIKNARKKPAKTAEQELVQKAGDPNKLPEYKQESPGGYMDLFLPNAVSLAQRNQEVNQAAQEAPVGGYWSKPGFEKADKQAKVEGSDMTAARNLMRYGGMLGTQQPPLTPKF